MSFKFYRELTIVPLTVVVRTAAFKFISSLSMWNIKITNEAIGGHGNEDSVGRRGQGACLVHPRLRGVSVCEQSSVKVAEKEDNNDTNFSDVTNQKALH